ncbi:exo-alpha-sialidase [Candidatus Nomurabacteria bacterium]|nr:exo-alpha-sialidase [Candidatus Nomurabacteria bacterium]
MQKNHPITKVLAVIGILFIFLVILRVIRNNINSSGETPGTTINTGTTSLQKEQIVDCVAGSSKCPELTISGDSLAKLPNGELSYFKGFADPSIRSDPVSRKLWLAYSWPNIHAKSKTEVVPGVDIHLASSSDGGDTWTYEGALWDSKEDNNVVNGESGYTDNEVVNLLPVEDAGEVTWYAVRIQYFLPTDGGFKKRPVTSFRLKIGKASSPLGLSSAEMQTLGAVKSDQRWGIDQNLSDLSSDAQKCQFWNEPSLYYEDGRLYLVVRCLAFTLFGLQPDAAKSDQMVFYTDPSGDAKNWKWTYVGILAGNNEAKEFGADGITQVDIVKGEDGALLAVFSPDRYDSSTKDFIHYGCRVVEINPMSDPGFKRDSDGNLIIRAAVNTSDLSEIGPGACSYDPESSTGIIITRREKTSTSLTAGLYVTGLHP